MSAGPMRQTGPCDCHQRAEFRRFSIMSADQPAMALPSAADVVIIGAGVNGLATAFELSKRGAGRIVVLERRFIGAGASGKSGALVRQHYANTAEAVLTRESLPIFQNWNDYVGQG